MNYCAARYLLVIVISCFNFLTTGYSQTAASPWQARYATGGTGAHVGEICWLTWGTAGNTVANGVYYWNLTPAIQAVATITGVTSDGNNANPLTAYSPGTYSGDGLQLLYSGVNPIGLRDRVSGDGVGFNISIQLLINGVSAAYPGLVIGDAESMAIGEYISAETAGTGWQVLDLRNAAPASAQSDYQLAVSNLQKKFTIQSSNSSNQGMQAVLFAQGATSLTNVKLKGGGLTALALGLIVPFDFADAPASYGAAGHFINGFVPTGTTVTNGTYPIVNITKSNLVPAANVYLGQANIDADANPPAGPSANYDDTSGTDDENGVVFPAATLKVNESGSYAVTVTATNSSAKNATVYGWIDFNVDGIFSSNEIATAVIPAGTNSPVTVSLVYDLDNFKYAAGTFRAGASYGRFRITTDSLTNMNASNAADQRSQTAAADGEVEDYRVDIAAITISGSIYNDANGLTDSMVNGTLINSLSASPVYVYLSLDGIIYGRTAAANDGSYSFTNANPGSNYVVTLATDGGQSVGASLSAVNTVLPTGWVNTGVTYGANNTAGLGISNAPEAGRVLVGTGVTSDDITHVNFGLERTPINPTLIYFTGNPPVHSSMTITAGNNIGPLSATDPEDGDLIAAQTLMITSLADMNGNLLYYNNVMVSAGTVINFYDPSLLKIVFENPGPHSAGFNFSFRDAAGKYSGVPGSYTLEWNVVLQMTLANFLAARSTDGIKLSWATINDEGVSGFDVQFGTEGQAWKTVGHVNSLALEAGEYDYTDVTFRDCPNLYYRLKIIKKDGSVFYSDVKTITSASANTLRCYPNPTRSRLNILSQKAVSAVRVLSMSGSTLLSVKGFDIREIELQRVPRGCYMVEIFFGAQMTSCVTIVKQ